MNSLWQQIRQRSGWNLLVAASKRWPFPGAPDVSVYDVVAFLIKEWKRDSLNVRAASMAFSLFLSLFPLLVVMFTVIPLLPLRNFQEELLDLLSKSMPQEVFHLIEEAVTDIVMKPRTGLLSVSLLLSFYFASNGVLSMLDAFDKMHPGFRQRSFWQKQLVALKILALLFALLLLSITLIIGGEWLVSWVVSRMQMQHAPLYLWFTVLRFTVVITAFYVSVGLIYHFGPATSRPMNIFSPGTALGTILLLLVTLAFSTIITRFIQYNQVYGSIGTVLFTQLWIYYNSLSLLIGFEFNAAIHVNRHLSKSD
ncbi:MAG: YihY/virulence factor BrkB family protein [Chitinophagales bacterium]|nr:YihY/virulence factor BrkB family protein [Chitinophagales bacterium]MDW8428184.1 YihY/virulence factor BrkB family protein [Chitinophagales bacterium]